MSQKSSLPQSRHSVQLVLTGNKRYIEDRVAAAIDPDKKLSEHHGSAA
jgi:hypothetical protein